MKLAVMQPYLFPHIGYFQLVQAADLFLIYDDVAYIKRGYVNRNTVLSPNGPIRFTVPVPGASQNKRISDLAFSKDVAKVLKTIQHSYAKAPYFDSVFPLIEEILEHPDRSIAAVCLKSYQTILSYLGLEQSFKKTSELSDDRTRSGGDRLIALCHKFAADCYINAPGGRSLYTKSEFAEQGVTLRFIDSLPVTYPQVHTSHTNEDFVPNLSIIDVLMNCPPQDVVKLMGQYRLD